MVCFKSIKDLKDYIEPWQIKKLIGYTYNLRDKLLVRITWRTGIKVSELIGLRIEDIDFDSRAIFIKVQKIRQKTGRVSERRRIIPIDQGTLDMVSACLV